MHVHVCLRIWITTSCSDNQFQDVWTNLGYHPLLQELSHGMSCLDYHLDC